VTDAGSLSEEQLVEAASSTRERIRDLAAWGMLVAAPDGSFARSDIARIRVADALERSGIPVEGIARAVEDGTLSFGFVGTMLPEVGYVPGTTMGGFAADHGVPWSLIASSLVRFGLPVPGEDEPIREDDAAVFPSAAAALGLGLPEDALVRFSRLVGESLRKLADAQVDLFDSAMVRPMIGAGLPEMTVLENAAQMGRTLQPMMEELFLWVFRRHQEHAIVESVIEHVEDALDRAGVAPKRDARPSAIAFLDLSGFTRLTETQGDHAAAELAASLAELVQDGAHRHRGEPVKFLGDGVMFHFADPADAVACALELVEGARGAGLPPAHVGIHAGPIVYRDGDYFGRTVNLAARIADKAGPHEVFVSADTVDACRDGPDGVAFEPAGEFELKGVAGPFRVWRAVPTGEVAAS
jgi:adenylate cyclase